MDDRTFDRISRGLAGKSSRRQALKLLGGGFAGGALATTGLVSLNRAAAGTALPTGITGPISAVSDTNQAVEGVLSATQFINAGGTLTVVGELLSAIGGAVLDTFTAEVVDAEATCTILDLTLGPINLDLLGLVVETNQIELDITAVQGAGNLLGNLLCAVTNLLNGGGPLGAIAGLLNRILRALGAA